MPVRYPLPSPAPVPIANRPLQVFMKNWCRRLLSSDFSSPKTFTWMDKVGVMHTGVHCHIMVRPTI